MDSTQKAPRRQRYAPGTNKALKVHRETMMDLFDWRSVWVITHSTSGARITAADTRREADAVAKVIYDHFGVADPLWSETNGDSVAARMKLAETSLRQKLRGAPQEVGAHD